MSSVNESNATQNNLRLKFSHPTGEAAAQAPSEPTRCTSSCGARTEHLVVSTCINQSPAPPHFRWLERVRCPSRAGLPGWWSDKSGRFRQRGHPGRLLRRPPPRAKFSSRGVHMTRGGPEGWCVCGEDRAPRKRLCCRGRTGADAQGGRGSAPAVRKGWPLIPPPGHGASLRWETYANIHMYVRWPHTGWRPAALTSRQGHSTRQEALLARAAQRPQAPRRVKGFITYVFKRRLF